MQMKRAVWSTCILLVLLSVRVANFGKIPIFPVLSEPATVFKINLEFLHQLVIGEVDFFNLILIFVGTLTPI
jgi:hypothetical protein